MDKIPGLGKSGSGIHGVAPEKDPSVDVSVPSLNNRRSTKIVQPTIQQLEQGRGVNKDLFERKASLFTMIKNSVSDLYWWMKGCALTRKQYTGSLVAHEFRYFSSGGHLARQLSDSDNVKGFLGKSDYFSEVNKLFTQLRTLQRKEDLYSHDASLAISKCLEPDTCTSERAITDLRILKENLAHSGIELAETGNKELDAQLATGYLEHFKATPLARCYRFYQLFGGLNLAINLLMEKLLALQSAGERRLAYLEEVKQQLNKVQLLTLGLCHAELKAQMPDFYNDQLYTPLKVTDETGAAYFRSDLIQPRGGWKDTEEAIAMARGESN